MNKITNYAHNLIDYLNGEKIIEDTSKIYKKVGLEKLVKLSEHILGRLDERARWLVESDYAFGTIGLLGTLGIDALVHTDPNVNSRLLIDNGNWNFVFLCSYTGLVGSYLIGLVNHIKYGKRRAHTN